ncbi:MAG: hypothetical protein AMXMBFR33_38950 [Candidatus Xenobia bacterium]
MLFAVLPPHAVKLAPGPSLLGPEPLRLVREVLEELDQEALDLPALASSLQPLTRALAGYAPAAGRLLDGLAVTQESSRLATLATREHEGQELLEHYVVYDAQFGLRRRPEMTWTELSAQLVLTGLRLLQDLPRTLLARRHWHSLLLALERMLAEVGGDQPCQPLDPAPLEGDVVDFRWRNGHHFFCLTSLFARLALERALCDLEQAGLAVDQATDMIQATSAAMAYTTDFPSRIYLERVRPAMPPGFSGSQNSDYNHLKLAKGRLAAAVSQRFTGEQSWPPSLLNALRRLRVLDQLDLDEHIMIAAQQIGLTASLKQAFNAEQGTAIDALRRTQSQRWLEFRLP